MASQIPRLLLGYGVLHEKIAILASRVDSAIRIFFETVKDSGRSKL